MRLLRIRLGVLGVKRFGRVRDGRRSIRKNMRRGLEGSLEGIWVKSRWGNRKKGKGNIGMSMKRLKRCRRQLILSRLRLRLRMPRLRRQKREKGSIKRRLRSKNLHRRSWKSLRIRRDPRPRRSPPYQHQLLHTNTNPEGPRRITVSRLKTQSTIHQPQLRPSPTPNQLPHCNPNPKKPRQIIVS
jgi:hypothetical protein